MSEIPTAIKAEHLGKKYIIKHTIKANTPTAGKRYRFINSCLKHLRQQSKEDFWALKDLSFEIKQGERVGIIGKNGAGKSTLLKLLSRITEPTQGRIELLGKISAMLEVGTGFNPELTGRENVYLNGAILGMSKTEIDNKFDQIVEFSEIGKFIDTPVKRYSSGMYVRLAFSVASHLDPDILIIDEVLAVGDQKFRQKCLDRMNEIARGNKTILCVSHQMNVIRELCDRVIVIQNGELIYDGDVEGGIRIYSDDEIKRNTDFFELREKERPAIASGGVHMNSFEILNTDERLLGLSEQLKFRLHWTSNTAVENVKFRIIIRSGDDIAVGMALSGKLCDAKNGESYNNGFSLDTSCLFPDEYRASLSLYISDSTGRSLTLDHLTGAVLFEKVKPKNFDNSVVYDNRYWGHVRLPDLEIVGPA